MERINDHSSPGMVRASILLELASLRAMSSLAAQRVTSLQKMDLAQLNAWNTSLKQVNETLARFTSDLLSHMT